MIDLYTLTEEELLYHVLREDFEIYSPTLFSNLQKCTTYEKEKISFLSFEVQCDYETKCGIAYGNRFFGIRVDEIHYKLKNKKWSAIVRGIIPMPVSEQAANELNYMLDSLIDHTN